KVAARHGQPPFHVELLGSLFCMLKLLDTCHAYEAGKENAEALRKVEDRDVQEIVKAQVSLGFHAITDGEYRRYPQGITKIAVPDPDVFRIYSLSINTITKKYKPRRTLLHTSSIKHKGSSYTD
ncbi:uncharacterized protein A1O9_11729, partial [Exophiala aquamarina CBS 119918]